MAKEKEVKPLEARVKSEYFMNSLIAFSGKVYDKTNWLAVPVGQEENAKVHEWLELREVGSEKVLKSEPVSDEVDAEPVEVSKPTFRRTRKDKDE